MKRQRQIVGIGELDVGIRVGAHEVDGLGVFSAPQQMCHGLDGAAAGVLAATM